MCELQEDPGACHTEATLAKWLELELEWTQAVGSPLGKTYWGSEH